jgi:hypothetical protein
MTASDAVTADSDTLNADIVSAGRMQVADSKEDCTGVPLPLQTEVQIEEPVSTNQTESEKSKFGRGGRRPGAGRKPNYAKRLLSGMKPLTAAEAIEGIERSRHSSRSAQERQSFR